MLYCGCLNSVQTDFLFVIAMGLPVLLVTTLVLRQSSFPPVLVLSFAKINNLLASSSIFMGKKNKISFSFLQIIIILKKYFISHACKWIGSPYNNMYTDLYL